MAATQAIGLGWDRRRCCLPSLDSDLQEMVKGWGKIACPVPWLCRRWLRSGGRYHVSCPGYAAEEETFFGIATWTSPSGSNVPSPYPPWKQHHSALPHRNNTIIPFSRRCLFPCFPSFSILSSFHTTSPVYSVTWTLIMRMNSARFSRPAIRGPDRELPRSRV